MTKKYAIITNQETKTVDVGLGTDEQFYKSIGMTEMDVEQAYNGGKFLESSYDIVSATHSRFLQIFSLSLV